MEHPSHTSAADMLAVDVQYLSRRDLVAAFGAGRRQVEGFGVDTSSPVTVNLASVGGMSEAVNLSCSGLPVGMSCNFNPAQLTLTAGGQSTASLTITANAVAVSSFWGRGIGLLLLPLSLGSLVVVRHSRRKLQGLVCLLVLLLVAWR